VPYKDYYVECINNKGWITVGHVQYKLVKRVLYFQCSNGIEDWKSNFDFPVTPYKYMETEFQMHHGFAVMWKSVRDIIATLGFDVIIGYSQGAVFACLAYEDTLFNKHIKCPCIVFGCPRFLWIPPKTIRNRFKDVIRVCNSGDIVTHTPPFIFGYWHIGIKMKLKNIAKKPSLEKWWHWITGHTQSRYLQNLGGLA
jgi:Lipase (class 3)